MNKDLKNDDINDASKRNENWVYFIDDQTKIGKWIPIGENTTVENGKYTLFYFNGNIMEKGVIKNKEKYDTIYSYDIDGKLFKRSYKTSDSTYEFYRDGKYKTYTPKGVLMQVGEKRANLDVGMYINYYENGNKEQENIRDTNSLVQGVALWWYESGQLQSSEEYLNGELNGTSYKYFPSGQIESKRNYKIGIRDGIVETWYENGQQKAKCFYKNGKAEGEFIYWYENSKIKAKVTYQNNIKNGKYENYYENGQKYQSGFFNKDEKSGIWKEWDEEGNLLFNDEI